MAMRLLICCLVFAVVGCREIPLAQSQSPSEVLTVARAFGNGGSYDKKWRGSGVPEEINFAGEKILPAGEGTYCCGFTFAVAMRTATARGLLQSKTPPQIRAFQKEWYGATEESKEIECVFAVKKLGIGQTVLFDEARPGDFVQFWRGKSGHSVIFLSWVEQQGQKVGMRYRSSQPCTNGIGEAVEYFRGASAQGEILKERTYFCRLNER